MLISGLDASFFGEEDSLVGSKAVDWYRRRRLKSLYVANDFFFQMIFHDYILLIY